MAPEEIHILSIIFNKHAHVENGKWKDSRVLMLFQFFGIEGITLFLLVRLEDSSRLLELSVHQGRRRSNRFRNEMDIRHPEEPRKCGLCHQPGHNRRNCSNSQPRYNAM
uniref:CCHC-type domain-containing protein n=1 Tax=Lactuca sativa TaxID=4236 RepID=A0A9R1W2J3_LACSA|nr:hypothetical protein LSAT_V11C300133090 [Lactuca sativa]